MLAAPLGRRELERMVGHQLADASGIWLTADLGALRDEEGALDADKMSELLDKNLQDQRHWRAQPRPDFSSGVRRPIPRLKSLGEAFKGAPLGGR